MQKELNSNSNRYLPEFRGGKIRLTWRSKNEKGAPLNCRSRLSLLLDIAGSYIFAISTDARVVSQSKRIVQPAGVLSKAIVKFSTTEGSVDAFMSMRARSSDGPG